MSSAPPRAARRITAAFAAIALATAGFTLAAAFAAPPAVAHTQLADSSPTADEVLATAPAEVVLEFGGTLLDIGAIIVVVDASGADWTAGDLLVERSTARIGLREDMPDGRYEVRWQVVADDGHPLSGVIPFGIGEAGAESAVTGPPAQTGSGLGDTGAANAAPDPRALETGAEVLRLTLIGLGGAAIGLLGLLLGQRLRRRTPVTRTTSQGEDDSLTTHTHS